VGERSEARVLKLPPCNSEYLTILGRASGKSTLGMLFVLLKSLLIPNCLSLLVSPTLDQSDSVLMRIARQLSEPLRGYLEPRSHDFLRMGSTRKVLRFKNGAEVRFTPNREMAARGFGPRYLIADEAAAWPLRSSEGKDLPTFLSAIRPRMIAQYPRDYRILLLTTPRMSSGPIWDMWQQTPGNMAAVRFPTFKVRPRLKRKEFKHLSKVEYKREIKCEFASAEDSPLPVELLDDVETEPGKIPAPKPPVLLGVDVGFRRDFTGFCVGSRSGDLLYIHELKRAKFKKNVARFIETVKAMQRKWHAVQVLLDQYSADAISELLRRENIRCRIMPWSARSRTGAFDRLRILLEERRIVIPRSRTLREEVAGLTTRITPSGQQRIQHGSGHDDLLFSLLLTTEQLRAPTQVRFRWLGSDERCWKPVQFGSQVSGLQI